MKSSSSWPIGLLVVVYLSLVITQVYSDISHLKAPEHDPIAATRGLIKRRLGQEYNHQIVLRVLTISDDDLDTFEVDMFDQDRIEIAGNSATAMAHGLQWYLKNIVHTQTDWDNHEFQLPAKLPSISHKIRKERASRYSYYQNVCTVSYSSWTWGWEKWEKHIDWMAFNGINMPLAFTGQEKVWQNTFKNHFNISEDGLNKFFAGAAFLAWGRMGNIRGSWVKGHLPQEFIDDQYKLQLKILQRMREYGMIPALPAFAGHIPEELHVKFPEAKWTRSPNWGNFTEDFCCVYMLDPLDPLYLDIGTKFIEEQTRLYNNYTSHLYQCDTYNEMDPDSSDPEYLAASSKAVISSMQKADPKAVWLMQGWLFIDAPDFWTKDRVKAYLDAVPDTQMIILDLYSEVKPAWKIMENYFGKKWIYCVLHNFGGNTGMRGDLLTIGSDPIVARQQGNQTMIGMGLTMEGIFQNYVVYDLALQMAWEKEKINISEWIQAYAYQRYHSRNENAQKAWQVLANSVYNVTTAYGGVTKNIVTIPPHWKIVRDGFMPTTVKYDPKEVIKAWKFLLDASPQLGKNDAFRHDLVDVTRQFLSDHLLAQFIQLKTWYEAKQVSSGKICRFRKKMIHTIKDLDRILATNRDFLLGTWLEDAKALNGQHVGTKYRDYLEYEARNQITRWGDHNGNVLHDYACKEWAGLVKHYYLIRWRMWLTEVCQSYTEGRQVNEQVVFQAREQFELKWNLDHSTFKSEPTGDTIEVSSQLYQQYILEDQTIPTINFVYSIHVEDLSDIH